MTTADDNVAKPVSATIRSGDSISRDAARSLSAAAVSRVIALSPLIDEAAHLADLDSALLMAVIDVESGGNPQAVSPKGATGLMQLMPATGARLGASDLFDPRQNIAAGARYLKALIAQFGNLPLALAAYNAGEGAVQKYGGQIPPYVETMNYVPRVMARYQWYRNAASSGTSAMVREVSSGARERFMIVGSGIGD
ncbi:lytic transglycosylase domain-containing protein [Paraburkholderia bryophila]|uniref:lytic transglycosylase domain-containing protein n=1 Tax=Paraburkholderia bryophila TaxID=420952 RepID=UPI003AF17042